LIEIIIVEQVTHHLLVSHVFTCIYRVN